MPVNEIVAEVNRSVVVDSCSAAAHESGWNVSYYAAGSVLRYNKGQLEIRVALNVHNSTFERAEVDILGTRLATCWSLEEALTAFYTCGKVEVVRV